MKSKLLLLSALLFLTGCNANVTKKLTCTLAGELKGSTKLTLQYKEDQILSEVKISSFDVSIFGGSAEAQQALDITKDALDNFEGIDYSYESTGTVITVTQTIDHTLVKPEVVDNDMGISLIDSSLLVSKTIPVLESYGFVCPNQD